MIEKYYTPEQLDSLKKRREEGGDALEERIRQVPQLWADLHADVRAALDAGAEDMEREGDSYLITTPPAQLHAIDQALRSKQLPVQSAEIAMVPKNTVKVEGSDAKKLLNLMEGLEEMDDVAKVFSNFDIDAEAMAAVTG